MIGFFRIINVLFFRIRYSTTFLIFNFDQLILNVNKYVKCIGFSATPNLEIFPFSNILSEYTIYDAFSDDVILPPKIKWIHSDRILTDIDYFYICYDNIKDLYYKKIIVFILSFFVSHNC